MIDSTTRPARTSTGTTQLVRSWTPSGDPWAHVLLVHGLGEHSGRYERTGSLLAEAGISVRGFDLVGHGASGGRRGDIADWTVFLDQVEQHVVDLPRPLVLIGHSMGGLIALEYVLSERPRPDLVVLSAPWLEIAVTWKRWSTPIAGAITPRVRYPTGVSGADLSRDPAVGASYLADPLVLTKVTARFAAEAKQAMERVRSSLDRLSLPVLVLQGGQDPVAIPPVSLTLAPHPLVERRLYPSLRHEPFNEPEGPQVVAEVVEWVRERLTRSG